MERVEKTIEFDRPLRAVYDQCTQFELLPQFVPGLIEVRQLDHTRLRCRGELRGRWAEWETRITEQEPDRLISWSHLTGAQCAGTLRFHSLRGGRRTHLRLVIAWDGHRVPYGVVEARAQETLESLKLFIESRDTPTGAWRGQIDQGVSLGQPL